MANGNGIIVSAVPRGVFKEGTMYGTPKPGTIMEIKAGTSPVNGEFTWQPFSASNGVKQLIAVLLPDDLQGGLATAAYVTGTRCFLYCPVAGEELNILVRNIAGTADDITIGEYFMVGSADGKLLVNSSGASVPFQALEAVTDPVADTLTWCMYTGQ